MKFIKGVNLFKVSYEGKEGYVITTENSTVKDLLWVYRNGDIFQLPDRSRGQHIAMVMRGLEIIASTFSLGDLPQFVIPKEDKAKKEAEEYCIIHSLNKTDIIHSYKRGSEYKTPISIFQDGWNKCAKKYRFTKEDMCLFAEYVGNYYSDIHKPTLSTKDLLNKYIKSLQQPKEITEIEFETDMARFPKNEGWEVLPTGLKIRKSSKYPNGVLTIKKLQ